jgi:DNA-binding transcriptional LysR family regulator
MVAMRLEKLRQVDLNLLITFAVIAEEKSITAAASRLLLSQPAVSRALQRARAMLQDDLLVRSPHGFELTLRGRKILQELEGLLPKMEHLVIPSPIASTAATDPAPRWISPSSQAFQRSRSWFPVTQHGCPGRLYLQR